MSELYKRILTLCKEKGMTITQMCKESGASRGSLGDLANDRIQTLSAGTIKKISDYFDVSLDWLTGISKYRNNAELIRYSNDCANWGVNDPYFESAFDFASLLKPLREEQEVSISELGNVIGASESQMQNIEDGVLPITYEQAEKLCDYLGTDVSQVLFDNQLYDGDVPEEYHNNVRTWELKQKENEKESCSQTILSKKEITVALAYRAHPNEQTAVDRILEIDGETQNDDEDYVYAVARGGNGGVIKLKKRPGAGSILDRPPYKGGTL